jgi:hypothetical protein
MRKGLSLFIVGLIGALFLAAPQAKADILVGQCLESAACYHGTTTWSDTLSGTDLASLGLGSSVNLIAAQTSQFVIRLGVTTFDFTTAGSDVVETLPEFNGTTSYNDPCIGYCEVDTVGTFNIPINATGGTISGTFGNSVVSSSAGVDVCLGASCPAVSAVPEPSSIFLLAGMAGLIFKLRRRLA